MDVTDPLTPTFAALNGRPEFVKLETYLALSRMHPAPHFRIIETLVSAHTFPSPLFLYTSDTGYVLSTTCNAIDSFFRVTVSARLREAMRKPSPYRVPAYVLHLARSTHLAFDPQEARKLISGKQEFVLQRFVTPGDFTARKMRTQWTDHKHVYTSIIQHRSALPFNSLCVPERPERCRRFSFLTSSKPQERPRRASQLMMTLPPLHPDLPISHKRASTPAEEAREEDYLVRFRHADKHIVKDVGLSDHAPGSELIISTLAGAVARSGSLVLSTLVFDLIQTIDNQWVFLTIKRLVVRKESESSATRRSLEEILASFSEAKPMHRAPTVNMQEVQRQNIALYLKLVNS